MVKQRMKQFSVRITEDRYILLVAEAERQEITVALLARIAISEYCGRLQRGGQTGQFTPAGSHEPSASPVS